MNRSSHFESPRISRRQTETPSPSPSPSTPPLSRRQPLLQRSLSVTPPPPSPSSPRIKKSCGGSTAAEVCGGTTAECVAVWCCCPCGLVNLLVLAIYKIPAGICRRALRHHRRKRRRKELPPPEKCRCGGEVEVSVHPLESRDVPEKEDDFLELKIVGKKEDEEDEAVTALEKEMWNRFYGAGFWRSPSQRETVTSPGRGLLLLRGPSQTEAAPRTSFTGVFRNASNRSVSSPKSGVKHL